MKKMAEYLTKMLEHWMRIFEPSGSAMRVYVQFERVVGLILTVCVSVVILFAIAHLAFGLIAVFESGPRTFDYRVFQRLFEMILTVLIALEFNHSLAQVVKGRAGLVQVKTVVLIGILVVVRKFVLIDIDQTTTSMFLGLAAAILALGIVYWLVVDIDRRDSRAESPSGLGSDE